MKIMYVSHTHRSIKMYIDCWLISHFKRSSFFFIQTQKQRLKVHALYESINADCLHCLHDRNYNKSRRCRTLNPIVYFVSKLMQLVFKVYIIASHAYSSLRIVQRLITFYIHLTFPMQPSSLITTVKIMRITWPSCSEKKRLSMNNSLQSFISRYE